MESGFSFVDILVSEVTMVIAALVFLFCGAMLIFKRKSLNGSKKGLAVTALLVTGIYLAFIIWLVLTWGGSGPNSV